MLPYQKVQHAALHNHSVDAMVVIDKNGDGRLDADEFKEALESLGVHLKDRQAAALVELYDVEGKGFVSTGDFLSHASMYVGEDGHIDFRAFAKGVVGELEEEFGRGGVEVDGGGWSGSDSDSDSDSDSASEGSNMNSLGDTESESGEVMMTMTNVDLEKVSER
tara:strand:- start:477 stop:968 length:492 start_codon:yes stop_codon:yes gene_type:complete